MSRPGVARRTIRVLALLLLGLSSISIGLVLAPLEAAGEPPRASALTPLDGGPRRDPQNITAISPFMVLIGKGNERYAAKDYPGAIDLYKAAIQLDPRHPLGPYVLGEAYLASNNLTEASSAFSAAAEIHDAKTPPLLRSHVLFAVADVYEREKKWEQARAAWQAYTEHAARLGDAGVHPLTGVARLKAIDDWLKLDRQYAIVRQRIAAEKSEAGAPKK